MWRTDSGQTQPKTELVNWKVGQEKDSRMWHRDKKGWKIQKKGYEKGGKQCQSLSYTYQSSFSKENRARTTHEKITAENL